MAYKYPVAKPSLEGNELSYVNDAIRTGWISSQGSYVKRFEEAFAKWNNMNYGVACSSGTSALVLALRSLGIREGDEVIVPEFTMIASAWAVSYTGATPVFIDCKDDLNIDENLIEGKITKKTKAIMPVHIYGRQCNMEKIMNIAYNYNLFVVEDSAEAHGVKPVGDIACFSLFANKIISSGEGGICVTNNKRLAEQMAHLRAMAFTPEHDFLHKKLAYNFRMTNLQAAVALAQVERIDEFLRRRKQIESWYDENLQDVPGVKVMPKRSVLWMYDILVENKEELKQCLGKYEIETRDFFKPMSRQPMYYDGNWKELNATRKGYNGIYLPTYFELTEQDIKYICDRIKEIQASSGELKKSLESGVSKRIPEELYKQILENMSVCCVDAVIVNKRRALLVYRKNEPAKDQWWVPGGRVLKNERLEDAIIRKVKEETGLEVVVEKKVGVYETMFERGQIPDLKTGVHTINVVFLVYQKDPEQEIKIDETSGDYKWISNIEEDFEPYVKKVLGDSGVFT